MPFVEAAPATTERLRGATRLQMKDCEDAMQVAAAEVWNPSADRITSAGMEVGIDLEGSHFGDALLGRPLDLSATAHSRVRVPVRFEWAGLGAGAKALLTKRAVGFAVTGRVLLDTPVGTETVVLKGTGNVPLTKLLK